MMFDADSAARFFSIGTGANWCSRISGSRLSRQPYRPRGNSATLTRAGIQP